MSYNALSNDDVGAQVSENTLKSITNQTDVNALTKAQISVGEYPSFIETVNVEDKAGRLRDYLYVANPGTDSGTEVVDFSNDTISVIDIHSNTVIDIIPVGVDPSFIEPVNIEDKAGRLRDWLYVANSGSGTISVIDIHNNTVIDTIPVGTDPSFIETALVVDKAGRLRDWLYVANSGSGTISVIDIHNNTVIDTTLVGMEPSFIETALVEFRRYLYVANSGSDTISVIDTYNSNTVIDTIFVGDNPSFIEPVNIADEAGILRDWLYVANSGSGTISIIETYNSNTVTDITVGVDPSFIGTALVEGEAGKFRDHIYVANSGSDTITVIDTISDFVIDTIFVGDNPSFIEKAVVEDETGEFRDHIYVANSGSDTISVIDTYNNNTIIDTIFVGDNPSFIGTFGDALYIANSASDTISIVDPLTNEEVAGMKFDIKPFGAGRIICNGLDAPIDRFLYVTSGAKCIAKSNSGFEFSSWIQNLPQNTSVTINASSTSDWLIDPIAAFQDTFSNDPEATLTVTRFGNFTAYFRALPPPVPAEFTFSLITIAITALVGSLLVPAAVGWFKSKKQTSRLNSFHRQMALVYGDGKVDENDVDHLNALNKNISDSYAAGKISSDQYTHLKNEVSTAFQQIFKKRIELVTDPNVEAFSKIKRDMKDAYATGKITELHYNLLDEQISDIVNNK